MKLLLGDCLDKMQDIPNCSVDMVLCDLPYGVTANAWDKQIPPDELWAAYNRIVKPNGAIVLHAQEPFAAKMILSNPKSFRYKWVWYKHMVTGFLDAKSRPLRDCEDILVFYRMQCKYNPQMRVGKTHLRGRCGAASNYNPVDPKPASPSNEYYPRQLLDFPAVRAKNGHPTQKPVPLLEYLIKTYTDPGEIVLDNCMGSGSTGVACVNTGREFIGIELDPKYFEMAERRITEAKEQIFMPEEGHQ